MPAFCGCFACAAAVVLPLLFAARCLRSPPLCPRFCRTQRAERPLYSAPNCHPCLNPPLPHNTPPTAPQRARELLTEGDQGAGGSGIKILLGALAAAPGLQTLLADAVVHSQLARWTLKRSLLKCLEAAVLTTSDHRCVDACLLAWPLFWPGAGGAAPFEIPPSRPRPAGRRCPPTNRPAMLNSSLPLSLLSPLPSLPRSKEVLANDGVGVIVRSCRWRAHDAAFRPKQEVGSC